MRAKKKKEKKSNNNSNYADTFSVIRLEEISMWNHYIELNSKK